MAEEPEPEPCQSFIRRGEVNEYYRSIFDRCDQNHDGWISLKELEDFVAHEKLDIPGKILINISKMVDVNGDGRIDYCEFIELLNGPNKTLRDYAHKYISYVVAPNKLKRRITVTGLYEDEYKCNLYSVFLLMISFLQIGLFFVDKILFRLYNDTPLANFLKYEPEKQEQIWRYVTYMFIHADEFHLFANILVQLLIGIPLEMVHSYRVLIIYLVGVLAGCLSNSAVFPSHSLRGASAGVNSLYTAHIASVIINWREMTYSFAHLLLFLLITICDPVWNYIMYRNTTTTSYISHIAGAIVGLLFGVPVLKNLRETKFEKIIWWVSIVGFIVFMIMIITSHIQVALISHVN